MINYSVQDNTGKKILMGPTIHLQEAQDYINNSGKKDLKLMQTAKVATPDGGRATGWVEYKKK